MGLAGEQQPSVAAPARRQSGQRGRHGAAALGRPQVRRARLWPAGTADGRLHSGLRRLDHHRRRRLEPNRKGQKWYGPLISTSN